MSETYRPLEPSNLGTLREVVEGSKGRTVEGSDRLTKSPRHIGTVGDRVRLLVRVTERRGVDSPFGPFYTVRMRFGASELVWRSSSDLACSLREGARMRVTARVKAHQVGPLGQPVTVLKGVRSTTE